MPNNNTYTTTIFLNDEQAVNRLNALQASVENYRKAKQKALLDGDDKAFKTANRQIKECEKEMKALSTTAQNVDRVLSNLSTAAVYDIKIQSKPLIKSSTAVLSREEQKNGTTSRISLNSARRNFVIYRTNLPPRHKADF